MLQKAVAVNCFQDNFLSLKPALMHLLRTVAPLRADKNSSVYIVYPSLFFPSYLQVADFLSQLFNEMVWPDMIRYLTGGLSHLQNNSRAHWEKKEVGCWSLTHIQQIRTNSEDVSDRVTITNWTVEVTVRTLTSRFNQVLSALIKAFTPSTR